MAQLTALKGKPRTRKKAPRARRIVKGAAGAPMDNYKKCKNYFHFEVENKEYVSIVKAYVKKTFDKKTAGFILRHKDSRLAYSHIAAYCHWVTTEKEVTADNDVQPDSHTWMENHWAKLAEEGAQLVEIAKAEEAAKPKQGYTPSIQERIKEASSAIIAMLEEDVDKFITDPKKYKVLDSVRFFRKHSVNQAHARHIKAFYEPILAEYTLLQKPAREQDEGLKEAYQHLGKAEIKKAVELFQGIISACDLITAESKATRKTRTPKPKSADKLVAKMKYCKSDEKYKVASINPADIIDAQELWVFNVKTRKIGKYVAEEHATLQVKGTTLQFFDANQSVAKTLRKPEQQLAEFNKSGKVQLRKFLGNIKGVETKLNGRFNADTVILKAVK